MPKNPKNPKKRVSSLRKVWGLVKTGVGFSISFSPEAVSLLGWLHRSLVGPMYTRDVVVVRYVWRRVRGMALQLAARWSS